MPSEKGSDEAKTKTGSIAWEGLDAATAALFQLALCCLRNRRPSEASPLLSEEKVPSAVSVGCMLGRAFEFIKGDLNSCGVLTQKHVANELNISDTKLSEFLQGEKDGPNWISRGRAMLWFIVTGQTDVNSIEGVDAEVARIAKEIDAYFFRDSQDQKWPKYFHSERAGSLQAWSYTELAGEVEWVVNKYMANGTQGEVTFVAGGSHAFEGFHNVDHPLELALARAAIHGVKLTFVLRGEETASRGKVSIDEFRAHRGVDDIDITCVPDDAPVQLGEFLNPEIRYVRLRSGDASTLWIVRTESGEVHIEPMPIALVSNKRESVAFERWLTAVKQHKLASAPSKKTRNPPKRGPLKGQPKTTRRKKSG